MIYAPLLLFASMPVVEVAQIQNGPAATQETPEAVTVLPDIEVTISRRGVALGGQEPLYVYDATQVQAFGASNIGELVTMMEAQTRSARGGPPIFLVNGRRISGFREIHGIPPEAIERTEILPEETALAYGYSADQRVMNFVLKPAFRSLSTSLSGSRPERGGRTAMEVENNILRIAGANRWSMDLEVGRDTALFETDRNIDRTGSGVLFDQVGNVRGLGGGPVDPALSALVGAPVTVAGVPASAGSGPLSLSDFAATAGVANTDDLNAYRTLLPRKETVELSGTLKRDLTDSVGGTFRGSLTDTSTTSYLGLPGVTLNLPSASPWSPFGNDVQLLRYIDNADALKRQSDSLALSAGVLFDGFVGDWNWTLSGNFDRTETETLTGRGVDATTLQGAVSAGAPALNPFGDISNLVTTSPRDRAHSVSTRLGSELVLTGTPWQLQAGGLRTTLKAGLTHQSLDSETLRAGLTSERSQSRDQGSLQASFDLPIASRNREVRAGLGDLSANVNLAYTEMSDFGGIHTIGGGLNWTPIERLSLSANLTEQMKAPSVSELNDPTLFTPNTPVFDFRTGQTVEVTRITGGDSGLKAEESRVLKLGLNWQPWTESNMRMNLAYTRTETDNQISSFPAITPDLEAALPERFTRDAGGNLLSIDARPLNFAKREQQDVQWGFNYGRAFGTPTPSAQARPGGPGGPGGPGAGGPRGGGRMGPPPGGGGSTMMVTSSGPGGGGGMGGGGRGRGVSMQPGQGMFNISLTHTWRVQDEVVIRDGLPVLDLLDGDSISGSGGQPVHQVQLQGHVFRKGSGMFLNANWQAATRVEGDALGAADLEFSDRLTVNLNLFTDLSQRTALVERFPILRGTRLSFGVTNLFDERLSVVSSDGVKPVNYQPDYLDPLGRTFRLNIRKILF